jgi:hypothetical protein
VGWASLPFHLVGLLAKPVHIGERKVLTHKVSAHGGLDSPGCKIFPHPVSPLNAGPENRTKLFLDPALVANTVSGRTDPVSAGQAFTAIRPHFELIDKWGLCGEVYDGRVYRQALGVFADSLLCITVECITLFRGFR